MIKHINDYFQNSPILIERFVIILARDATQLNLLFHIMFCFSKLFNLFQLLSNNLPQEMMLHLSCGLSKGCITFQDIHMIVVKSPCQLPFQGSQHQFIQCYTVLQQCHHLLGGFEYTQYSKLSILLRPISAYLIPVFHEPVVFALVCSISHYQDCVIKYDSTAVFFIIHALLV